MGKGFLASLEIIPLFLAWMMILAGIWAHAAFLTEKNTHEWKITKIQARANAWSDILVHEHGKKPWEGCAHYTEDKKRVQEYVVEHDCLEKLDQNAPAEISHVGFRGPRTRFSILDANKKIDSTCGGSMTPMILVPENEMGVLDVVACE